MARVSLLAPGSIPVEFEQPQYRHEVNANTWGDWHRTAALIRYLTMRHLATRYRGSALGFLWSFLNPLMMMSVYTFVFQFLSRASVPGVPYPLFLLTGFISWNFFSIGIMNAASSVVEGSYLYNKTYFPRFVLPISSILSNGVNYIAGIVLLLIFNAFAGVKPTWNLLLTPLLFAQLLLMTVAFGLLIASFAPSFRDIFQLLEIIISFWFFLTPIFYVVDMPKEKLAGMMYGIPWLLYQANPMMGTVRLAQSVLLGQPTPWGEVIYAVCFGIVLCTISAFIFNHQQSKFSENV